MIYGKTRQSKAKIKFLIVLTVVLGGLSASWLLMMPFSLGSFMAGFCIAGLIALWLQFFETGRV